MLYAIAAVKKEKTAMSFKSSIGPSHPIFEIATSHLCRLKRLETNHDSLIKGVMTQCHNLWVSIG